jgi:hypothetical protein
MSGILGTFSKNKYVKMKFCCMVCHFVLNLAEGIIKCFEIILSDFLAILVINRDVSIFTDATDPELSTLQCHYQQ